MPLRPARSSRAARSAAAAMALAAVVGVFPALLSFTGAPAVHAFDAATGTTTTVMTTTVTTTVTTTATDRGPATGAAGSTRSGGAGRAPRFAGAAWVAPDGPPPRRVVSLSPVATETLFALGAGHTLVGVTRFCDRPDAARALPQVGGLLDASLERVLALRPDLVVAAHSAAQQDLLSALGRQGVPVLVVFSDSSADVDAMIAGLGDVLQQARAADALQSALQARRARLRQHGGPPLRALVVVGTEPLVVAGPGTLPDEGLMALGLVNVVPAGAPAWPQWSLEVLAAHRPDVIVAAEGPPARARLQALLARLPGAAPRVLMGAEPLLMRPGPSWVADLETLAALLTPHAPVPPAPVPPAPVPPAPVPPAPVPPAPVPPAPVPRAPGRAP